MYVRVSNAFGKMQILHCIGFKRVNVEFHSFNTKIHWLKQSFSDLLLLYKPAPDLTQHSAHYSASDSLTKIGTARNLAVRR